ncbi:hypothetical protein EDB80DRAFT_781247 [Ilyonectria destructans]|nr:hypothetical protein EDB80DRAFT_781247 [Ilyonectria destructans]
MWSLSARQISCCCVGFQRSIENESDIVNSDLVLKKLQLAVKQNYEKMLQVWARYKNQDPGESLYELKSLKEFIKCQHKAHWSHGGIQDTDGGAIYKGMQNPVTNKPTVWGRRCGCCQNSSLSHGILESESHQVWIAVALHTSPGIAERIYPLSRMVRYGVMLDFSAATRVVMGAVAYSAEVEAHLPRLDIEKVLGDTVVHQAELSEYGERPDSLTWPSLDKHPKAIGRVSSYGRSWRAQPMEVPIQRFRTERASCY